MSVSSSAASAEAGLLTIDVSNTETALAFWRGEVAACHWKLGSHPGRTSDEYRVLIGDLLAREGLAAADVRGCALACVVPEIGPVVDRMCRKLFGRPPFVVGPGTRTGMDIRADNPRELGADRIANAVAARARFGSPAIVIDFGTAITFDVVGADGSYTGAVIAPGLDVAAAGLARRASRIGRTEVVAPPNVIADNTEQALQSGLVFGFVGLVEGLVARVRDEIGPAPVVVTGDARWLPAVLDATRLSYAHEPLLTLDGLRRIHGIAAGQTAR